ncbi:response regulator [Comamonas sp. Y33R10-2]|uniref:response regulator n=1 Tax=Comamonas sp. Y33R10-2 TaxID=2853257 RepID=UPI001C5C8758|nr:response regulator [Comamonas sp. Y33R10-2]QXZ08249.1 response regulator [Comamonas sp. Y33R10-2]
MLKRALESLKQPSLRLTIIGIVLLVLLPTLGVVLVTLFNAGKSFQEATTRQLQETARTVARSTANELELTSSVLLSLAELHSGSEPLSRRGAATFANGTYEIYQLSGKEGSWQFLGARPDQVGIQNLALQAAQTGRPQISDIVDSDDSSKPYKLAFAVPKISGSSHTQVTVLITTPADLIHSLYKNNETNLSVILAIVDSTGRILGRSVNGEQFLGKKTPDWNLLKESGTDSGFFKARTLEGRQIMFAFQRISGTPGWVAVVGEAASSFEERWQRPIKTMLIASVAAVLLAFVLALTLAQRAMKPIRHLAARARRIASGQATQSPSIGDDIPPSFVAEFETLRLSLDEADKVLNRSLEESRSAEKWAQENNAVLRAAERQAKLGHWSLDVRTGTLTSSEMLSVLYGDESEPSDMPIQALDDRLVPESARRIDVAMTQCVETGEPYAMEIEHRRADGSTFAAYVQGSPVKDADGRVVKIVGIMQDISERKEQHERLVALADNLPSGVIFRIERDSSQHLKLAFLSAGLETLTGLPSSEILQNPRKLLAAVPAAASERLQVVMRNSNAAGKVVDEIFPLQTAYGQSIWIHLRAALRITGVESAVWDGIARDVTAEREAANALREAKEAAEAAEHAKSDFLATMSHEIRTPMNSVIGMARLAMRTDLNPKQRNYLEKINESANVLLGIINDILDFSKIEAGGLELERVPVRLESVLETVSSVTTLRAEEKGLEITYAVAPETPSMLKGDALRLGQVITNLVGNAIKFTEQGDVVVSVSPIWDESRLSRKLLFSVRDSGIGMTAEQVKSLFTPFTQAQSDISRRYGGTGLGLAISKRLVTMMGGEIWVESELDQGSTFFFTMMWVEAERETVDFSARNQLALNLKGRRILVVDDNASARAALVEMVRGFGMQVVDVDSGMAALELLRADVGRGSTFDIVLLDWRMPGMDGLETARHIQADAALGGMPAVLMVTAYGQDAMLQASAGMGLQAVLLKPVTQSLMFNTLLGVFSGSEGVQQSRSTYVPSDVTAYAGLRGKRVLVTDDNALNREVATDFLECVGVHVLTAVNGRDAIAQLEQHDVDAVLMDIHMPEMNGLEAAKQIRRQGRWAQLPIIALTAQARGEDQQLSREAGMNAHLTKPIDEVLLYSTLLQLCSAQKEVAQGGVLARNGQAAGVSAAQMFPRLPSSPKRKAELLRGFLKDFDSFPDLFEQLLLAERWQDLAELVHQIKGSASYLDAAQLCALANVIERAGHDGNGDVVRNQAAPFLRLVHECLAQVRKVLQRLDMSNEVTASAAISADSLALLDRLIPLVSRGDFAARQLLEQLIQGGQHVCG